MALPDTDTSLVKVLDQGLAHFECAVDVTFMVAFTGEAVIAIEKASQFTESACQAEKSANSECAIFVELAIVMLIWVGSFIAMAISSCAAKVTPEEGCASDVLSIAASITETIWLGTDMSANCDFSPELRSLLPPTKLLPRNTSVFSTWKKGRSSNLRHDQMAAGADGVLHIPNTDEPSSTKSFRSKRFRSASKFSQRHEFIDLLRNMSDEKTAQDQEKFERDVDRTLCSMEGLTAVASFMGAIRVILSTAKVGCTDPKVCTTGIISAVSYFGWMAATISFMFNYCPVDYNQHAACAADSAEMVGSIGFLAVFSSVVGDDCKEIKSPNTALSQQRRLFYQEEEE
mmetsp:Transcript_57846/g.126756  ORF Transcript_57846/g.126756 Transcript_57846/m.126756 type:complete len:344 (-) Transcript_57846:228-1259(-)